MILVSAWARKVSVLRCLLISAICQYSGVVGVVMLCICWCLDAVLVQCWLCVLALCTCSNKMAYQATRPSQVRCHPLAGLEPYGRQGRFRNETEFGLRAYRGDLQKRQRGGAIEVTDAKAISKARFESHRLRLRTLRR